MPRGRGSSRGGFSRGRGGGHKGPVPPRMQCPPFGGRSRQGGSWLEESGSNPGGGHSHTLADEARNTAQRRRGMFGQDARLRHRPVTFLSAGVMDPLKELEREFKAEKQESDQPLNEIEVVQEQIISNPTVANAVDSVEDTLMEDETTATANCAPMEGEPVQDVLERMIPDPNVPDVVASIEDTLIEHEPAATTNDAPMEEPVAASTKARSPSTSQLFTVDTQGDKSLRAEQQPPVVIPDDHDSGHATDSSEEVILFKGRDFNRQRSQMKPTVPNTLKENGDTIKLQQMDVEIREVEKMIQSKTTTASNKIAQQKSNTKLQTDAVLFNISNSKSSHSTHPSQKRRKNPQSDEEASLIADYMANMDKDDDNNEFDARPGLGSHAFHILRDLGGTDSDAVPETVSDAEEDSDDQRRRIESEDERLARILTNQEELGLGTDEILLDGIDTDGPDGWHIAPKTTPRRKKGSTKTSRMIQKKGQWPSATQMADAFDDLDLMDWHRPALNNFNNKKSHKVPLPHVSDSELEEAMQMAFQKDRLKKAEKKKQRESLRAQGLLGNVDPDDIRIKYPAGMRNDDLEYELQEFLLGSDAQLILPPLDKASRRLVHLSCDRMGIKTKSLGNGKGRYPVLYRTRSTIPYDEELFTAAMSKLLKQTYFPRADVEPEVIRQHKVRSSEEPSKVKRRNNVSVREGEIVGQHASELSTGNKGRLLLEKMGWSKGMSLGHSENQGILVPVVHVVKKSKAGLGDI